MGIKNLGQALCELLGLDPNKVRSITIRCGMSASGIPCNEVSVVMRVDSEIGLVEIMKEYNLVPKQPK